MDSTGNIYSVEQMRRELASMGEADPRREELERRIAEDEGRLDGYVRGRAESEQEAALKEKLAEFDRKRVQVDRPT